MAKREHIVAYLRRDDTDPDYPVMLVPGSWTVVREGDRWATYYPNDERYPNKFLHARLMVPHDTEARAVFVIFAGTGVLTALQERIDQEKLTYTWVRQWASVAAVREDPGAAATALRAAWEDIRESDGLIYFNARIAGFLDDDGEV